MSSELNGVNLARQALLAAREAARKNGATSKKPKRRTSTTVRRDDRELLGLGSAISRMMTERGMVAQAAGESVLADFDAILAKTVPELASRVQAVGLDADSGRLDVVPDVPARGTKLRWSAPQLIAVANETVLGANGRAREGRPRRGGHHPGWIPATTPSRRSARSIGSSCGCWASPRSTATSRTGLRHTRPPLPAPALRCTPRSTRPTRLRTGKAPHGLGTER
ncbi:hypothetical protein ACFU9B_39500 [Streptomyces sp. NPDC057592]|uniref:hypothetical protein n=1 Tax=unclassified Streptomyces TaxID=2593676 RepID=UPI0036904442